MYTIKIKKSPAKFIQSLSIKRQKQIQNIFTQLQYSPYSLPYKKIEEHLLRIRVGNMRILYEIKENEVCIIILKIGYRENFYS